MFTRRLRWRGRGSGNVNGRPQIVPRLTAWARACHRLAVLIFGVGCLETNRQCTDWILTVCSLAFFPCPHFTQQVVDSVDTFDPRSATSTASANSSRLYWKWTEIDSQAAFDTLLYAKGENYRSTTFAMPKKNWFKTPDHELFIILISVSCVDFVSVGIFI